MEIFFHTQTFLNKEREKMKRTNKFAAAILAAAMAVSSVTPAFAETQSVTTTDIAEGTTSKDVEVGADIASTFTVTIPKSITLTKSGSGSGTYAADFIDTVSGDIGETETISVTPDSSVQLVSSKSEDQISAAVTLGDTTFDRIATSAGTTATHNISATLTPGAWTGTMNVAIDVHNIIPGLYSLDGVSLQTLYTGDSATWDNLQKAGYISVNNGVLSAGAGVETTGVVSLGMGTALMSLFMPTAFADTLQTISGKLVLPQNGSIKEIADNTFANSAITLNAICLPASLTKIGTHALGTTKIDSVEFSGTMSAWNSVQKTSGDIITTTDVTCMDGVFTAVIRATVPSAINGLVYNGSAQQGVASGEAYTLSQGSATDAGNYTAVAHLNNGYVWEDGSSSDKNIQYTIAKAEITTPTGTQEMAYTGTEQTGVVAGIGYTITGNKATDGGSYTAVATLDKNHIWTDGTTDAKNISWSIATTMSFNVGLEKITCKAGCLWGNLNYTNADSAYSIFVSSYGDNYMIDNDYSNIEYTDGSFVYSADKIIPNYTYKAVNSEG